MFLQPSGEMDGPLSQRQIPVLNRMRPALRSLEYVSVKQLQQTVFIGEASLSLGQLTKLPVNSLETALVV